LKQGDILVVTNAEDAKRLKHCGAQLDPSITSIPIVVAPAGIKRVSLEYLKKIVEQLEKKA
jgi:hypothetical protein